jgi:hypothetical protein
MVMDIVGACVAVVDGVVRLHCARRTKDLKRLTTFLHHCRGKKGRASNMKLSEHCCGLTSYTLNGYTGLENWTLKYGVEAVACVYLRGAFRSRATPPTLAPLQKYVTVYE